MKQMAQAMSAHLSLLSTAGPDDAVLEDEFWGSGHVRDDAVAGAGAWTGVAGGSRQQPGQVRGRRVSMRRSGKRQVPAGAPEPAAIVATNDPLTKLPSREMFCREVEARTLDGGASGQRVAVLLLGVNDFKDVNSAFGHDAGDRILVYLAARMARFASLGWCVARADGDVFAVLAPVPPTESESVQDLFQQLAAVLADPFAVASGVRVQLSGEHRGGGVVGCGGVRRGAAAQR